MPALGPALVAPLTPYAKDTLVEKGAQSTDTLESMAPSAYTRAITRWNAGEDDGTIHGLTVPTGAS